VAAAQNGTGPADCVTARWASPSSRFSVDHQNGRGAGVRSRRPLRDPPGWAIEGLNLESAWHVAWLAGCKRSGWTLSWRRSVGLDGVAIGPSPSRCSWSCSQNRVRTIRSSFSSRAPGPFALAVIRESGVAGGAAKAKGHPRVGSRREMIPIDQRSPLRCSPVMRLAFLVPLNLWRAGRPDPG